jgi:hypothetical protein
MVDGMGRSARESLIIFETSLACYVILALDPDIIECGESAVSAISI